MQEKRKLWKEQQQEIDTSMLVLLDESGVNTDMTRRYARAKKGERANDRAPLNTGKTTTIVSSVRTDGTMVPIFLSGSLNGETFRQYIEQHLTPTLHEGDIVVMDRDSIKFCVKVNKGLPFRQEFRYKEFKFERKSFLCQQHQQK